MEARDDDSDARSRARSIAEGGVWKGEYLQFFGGQWRGGRRRPKSAAARRPLDIPASRDCVRPCAASVADLPSLLTDAARRPELIARVEEHFAGQLGVRELRERLQEESAKAGSVAVRLRAADSRLDALRLIMRSAAEAHPAFARLLTVLSGEYEAIVGALQAALRGSCGGVVRTTMEEMQAEIFALLAQRKVDAAAAEALRAEAAELRRANEAHAFREKTLRAHMDKLHDTLQRATQRVFISDSPDGDDESCEAGKSFHGITLDAAHTITEFAAAAKRLVLEVEHLRAANHTMGQARLEQQEDYVKQQSELNATRRRCNDNMSTIGNLRKSLEQVEGQLGDARSEMHRADVAESALATLRVEAAIQQQAQETLVKEMSRLGSFSAVCVGGVVPPPVRRRGCFLGKGLADSIPRHLRTKTPGLRIPQSHVFSAEEALTLLYKLWADRAEERRPRSSTLPEFACTWLAGWAEGGEQGRTETMYALDDAWRQLRGFSTEVDVTLSILDGRAPEALHDRAEGARRMLTDSFARLDKAPRGKAAAQQPGKMAASAVLRVLSDVVAPTSAGPPFEIGPAGRQYRTNKLQMAVAAVAGEAQELEAASLFAQAPVSPIMEAIIACVQQEHAAGCFAVSAALSRLAADTDGAATVLQIQGAMLRVDAGAPQDELQRRTRACVGLDGTDPLTVERKVSIADFVQTLQCRCFVRLYDGGAAAARELASVPQRQQ
eukprot:TRINITY_DN17418_c0_g1_i1.p1 TRINITY_DN17418_c0_g1~~TRINITY_DN17418_c0_g1_i1.p1  ORF type:complete len:739 (+),score=286.65 TRINITY_DN17418_c0_g1_i1:47-2218(+)